MTRRICLVSCLVLASVFLSAWNLLRPHDDRSRLLAEGTLRAARDAVYEETQSLLEAHEDELRITPEQIHPSQESKQLLNNRYDESSLHRYMALKEPSVLTSVKSRRIAEHQIDICTALAGKRVTMIGGEYIYRLHVYLLQQRERAEGKPFPCQYHEFCTHHHICLPYWQHSRDDTPPARYIKPPTPRELIQTASTAVNYIVSDTLFSSPNESSREYTSPYLHSMTGVRLRETFWLAAARKANIVVLGRGPLSPPAQTYSGNWSFLHHLPDYLDKPSTFIASKLEHPHQPLPQSIEILNAAVHLTVSRFLPELFRLLRDIRSEVRPNRQRRMIWPGSWFRLPSRGNVRTILRSHVRSTVREMLQRTVSRGHRPRSSSAEHMLMLQLSALINADITNSSAGEDPWTLLFNAQVFLQSMALSEILPRYGIVFLPLNVPWIEGDWAHGYSRPYSAMDIERDQMVAIGEAFLTGLDHVLEILA